MTASGSGDGAALAALFTGAAAIASSALFVKVSEARRQRNTACELRADIRDTRGVAPL